MSASIIAIDAMGGDFGPHCVVPACLSVLAEFPALELILVGQPAVIEQHLSQASAPERSRLHIHPASEVIAMEDRPAAVLRGKPDASMRVALNLVRDGQAAACVSAGNTGALMALSRQVLGTLAGVDRPAICGAVPTRNGVCQVLDLGANVDCSAEQLRQFAIMGAVAAEIRGVLRPRVALLNVGTEAIKGTQQIRLAADLLQHTPQLNYVGFVEGDGVYEGKADVVVCDGFAGNVLLKASEGLVQMVTERVEAVFRDGLFAQAVGALALPLMRQLRREFEPAQHNGASFLGLNGVVVKSHGAASPESFQSAIRCAVREIDEGLSMRLVGRIENLSV